MAIRLNSHAYEHARKLIEDGHFVYDQRDQWREHRPTNQEENQFIEAHGLGAYQKWYLGIDDEKPLHSHGHIRVDGRRVDRPSYRGRPGQVIEVGERSRDKPPFRTSATGAYAATHPPYLSVDHAALRARLDRLPARPEIPVLCDEQLVVEFYAR